MCMITGSFVQEYLIRQSSVTTVGEQYSFGTISSSTFPMNLYTTKSVKLLSFIKLFLKRYSWNLASNETYVFILNYHSLQKDVIKNSSTSTIHSQFHQIELNRSNHTMAASQQQLHDKIGYATSLCLVTGLWQVVLSVLKFGKLSWLMSEIVLSAFVTAAAFHILTSQLKSLFGIIIQRSPKLFGIVYVSFLSFPYFYLDV